MTALANRAYAVIQVKAMDEEKRTFTGWATTPALDRVGDTINPLGAKFTNPLVLLHQHKYDQPIGQVTFGKPTAKGIQFSAQIPDVLEPGPLRDRVNTAWGEIKYGLVRAVSIGFRAIKYAFTEDGGVDYQEVEIYEMSSVSIPALPEAIITSVKSMNPSLSAEMVREIKRFDSGRVAGGPVRLIQTKKTAAAKLPGGAVRLINSK